MKELADAQLIEAAVAHAKRVGPVRAARNLGVTERTIRRWETDPPASLNGPSRKSLLEKLPLARAGSDARYADGAQHVVDYVREALDRIEQTWLTSRPVAPDAGEGDPPGKPEGIAHTPGGDNEGEEGAA